MQAYLSQVLNLELEELSCFCHDCKATSTLSQAAVRGARPKA